MAAFIKINNLHKSFRRKKILDGITLQLNEGDSLVVLGKSGTGKSVLAKTILGIIKPDKGNVILQNVDVNKCDSTTKFDILSRSSFLFQNGALFDSLTVEENILFLASKTHDFDPKKARDLAASKLKEVGLTEEVLYLYPSELSGGMAKRVALARAICCNPSFIIFDEPTTGLDPIMSNVIADLINNIKAKLKSTIITITHDLNLMRKIASRIILLDEAKVAWEGSIEDVGHTNSAHIKQFLEGDPQGPISVY